MANGVIADVTGNLDPSNPLSDLVGTQINGKDVWSAYQTAQHIAIYRNIWTDSGNGNVAPDLEVTYHFTLGTTTAEGVLQDFGPGQQEMTRQVYEYISQITHLTFREVVNEGNEHANLHLQNQNHSSGGGGAYIPHQGDGRISIGGLGSTVEHYQNGSYTQHLLYHEGAGHALGLRHPGNYNGYGNSYQGNADHWNDSRQYTQMSYWGAGETGGSTGSLSTMGLHDILALQLEYGVNETTNTGNDIYGYNATNAGGVYDFTTGTASMGFSIWDAAGIDTLDFSGSNKGTQIDLRDGAFSSANGETHNVSIAYGAVVENAVGSLHADQILGNTANNVIHGGVGDDVIRGGLDVVPDFTVDPRYFTGIEINNNPLVRDQYLQVDNIQSLSGQAFTVELMVEIIRVPHDGIQFVSYAVPGSTNEFLLSSQGAGGLLEVTINGATYSSTINEERLVDGLPHRLSVSWDSTDGSLNIYIDGQLADSGTHQAGNPLATGGTLIFGQDQDSVGGGFQARQVLAGTIGDIRIFDDVRTAAEINDNRFTTLTGNEANLVNNWQVQAGDTTTVTDVAVDPALFNTNLTVHNGGTVRDTTPVVDQSPDNDTLYGEQGNDVLRGGWGDDTLYGHGGDLSLDSPFAATTGIALNQGVTDQYLQIANYGGFAGANSAVEFTLELLVSGLSGYNELFSYANGQSSNAFEVTLNNNGNINLLYRGAGHDTNIAASLLTDGGEHRFSISWDGSSPTSEYIIYIDGAEVGRGSHPRQNWQLDAGTLIFGQEQDAIGGGFNGNQILRGNIADIRIFNDIRTSQEITANAFAPLADPANEQGLVNNWQADGNSVANGALADAVGGTSLTITAPTTPVTTTAIGNWDDDTLLGGLGDDTLNGGAGNDVLDGGVGIDTASFVGEIGAVNVNLSANTASGVTSGTDQLISIENVLGSNHNDTIRGGAGDNRLDGAGGNDFILGYDGNDTIIGGDGINIIGGGAGNDAITGGGSIDYLYGNDGNDVIEGGTGNDSLFGGLGNDTLNGGAGFDRISGDGGDDVINGGAGIDVIGGGDGSDTIHGNDDIDKLFGNGGNDTIFGDAGNDSLYGGDGIDTLHGGIGNDFLYGQLGNDILNGDDGNDIMLGDGGNDTLHGNLGNDVVGGGAGNDTLYGDAGNDKMYGGLGDDSMTGGTGNDLLLGYIGVDTLDGGAGGDILGGGGGNDTVVGGAGADSLFGNAGDDSLAGGLDNDLLYGGAGNDFMDGGAGNDELRGQLGNDNMFGGAGDDLLLGYIGNDLLVGGDGNDILGGGAGNDILGGEAGNDQLFGNSGTDLFVFTTGFGNDIIYDFDVATEVVDLVNLTNITSFADVSSHLSDVNGNAVFTYGLDTITFNGVDVTSLSVDNFGFDAPIITL